MPTPAVFLIMRASCLQILACILNTKTASMSFGSHDVLLASRW
jgi:hypothetical protein